MTPQELYLSDPERKKWYASTIQTKAGEEALWAVFNQYCSDIPNAVDGATAISLNAKRQGALELVQRMMKFTVIAAPVPRSPLDAPLIDTFVASGSNSPVRKQTQ